jgi:hypothetical protein
MPIHDWTRVEPGSEDYYVPAPLEASYTEAWNGIPAMLKELIEPESLH